MSSRPDRPARDRSPRALARRVARIGAASQAVGLLLLATLAIILLIEAEEAEAEGLLRAIAVAGYGLGDWDEDGFLDHYLILEPELLGSEVQLSIATDAGIVFGPDAPEWPALVRETAWGDEAWRVGPVVAQLALPSYDDDEVVRGAVIATLPVAAWRRQVGLEILLIGGTTLALAGLGLLASQRLGARVLAALTDEIEEREQILAGAAHELRTPLAALLATIDTTPPDEAAQALPVLRDTVTRSSTMVERLLTWSRLARGPLAPEPVRLDLLVERCLAEDDPLEAHASVVQGDPRLIEVALQNLIENARHHGQGLARVVVSEGVVEVHDRGPGIRDPGLLAPFRKGSASRGHGLGLALVARIAERHGGRLQLSPVIALQLPLSPPPAPRRSS